MTRARDEVVATGFGESSLFLKSRVTFPLGTLPCLVSLAAQVPLPSTPGRT